MKYTPTNKEGWLFLVVNIFQCCFYVLLPALLAGWFFGKATIGAIFGLAVMIQTGFAVLSIEVKEAAGEQIGK